MKSQAAMIDSSVKAQSSQGDMSLKMAQLQTQNIAELNKKEALKIDAVNHAKDRQSKLKLEGLRLRQTEMIHKDKLTHDKNQSLLNLGVQHTLKGLDLGHQRQMKGFDLLHAMQTKGLDLDHAREQSAMQMAQQENQSAAQRLHDVAMADKNADIAREAQFMKPEGGE
jgi:hypothetical protein